MAKVEFSDFNDYSFWLRLRRDRDVSFSRFFNHFLNTSNLFDFCHALELPEVIAQKGLDAHAAYPLFVPKAFVAKMEKGNPRDTLLLQILPQAEELLTVDGFSDDPLHEQHSRIAGKMPANPGAGKMPAIPGAGKMPAIPGAGKMPAIPGAGRMPAIPGAVPGVCPLLQKYEGRILLLATNQCAVHCRYCFRRNLKKQAAVSLMRFLQDDSRVFPAEVILSGGDPLSLADDELAELLATLRARPQVRRIRIHTRFPAIDPKRLTPQLLSALRSDRKTVFSMVLHINHPREIDAEFADAMTEAVDRGIPVFVQSVLLRNVNDDFSTLFELYEKSISLRMTPYYLHQLDRVAGTAHFEVDVRHGLELMDRLRRSLPGYAVPRYVREIPGTASKTPVSAVAFPEESPEESPT